MPEIEPVGVFEPGPDRLRFTRNPLSSAWDMTEEERAAQYILADAEIPMSIYDTRPQQPLYLQHERIQAARRADPGYAEPPVHDWRSDVTDQEGGQDAGDGGDQEIAGSGDRVRGPEAGDA